MRQHADTKYKQQVKDDPAPKRGVISSQLPKWAQGSGGMSTSQHNRLPVQDVTNQLTGAKSKWQTDKAQLFVHPSGQQQAMPGHSHSMQNAPTNGQFQMTHTCAPSHAQNFKIASLKEADDCLVQPAQSCCMSNIAHHDRFHDHDLLHTSTAKDHAMPSKEKLHAAHQHDAPVWPSASGPLSAAPTGFSSDARLVVASLADPCLARPDRMTQSPARAQPGLSPSSVRQGSGWSALYDDSSEEEDAQGLQAEASQASSLSFQPHNLFKEHFAAAGTSPSKDTVPAYGVVRPLADQSDSTAAFADTGTPAQASASAGTEHQLEGAYTPRSRKLWEQHAEVKLKAKHTSASSPGATKQGAEQSPVGKPPLPRLPGRGSVQPSSGIDRSPRYASGSSKIPSSSLAHATDVSRSPSAPLSPTTKLRPALGSELARRSESPQATPSTPKTSRRGRLSAGRGLASQLQGMQAQLADLDAMWTAVNGPKPDVSTKQEASNSMQAVCEDKRDGSKTTGSCRQTAARSKIPLAPQAKHAVQSTLQQKASSKQSAPVTTAIMPSSLALAASSQFPGFAVRSAQTLAASGEEPTRGDDASDSQEAASGFGPPVQSPEVIMHGHAHQPNRKRSSAVSSSITLPPVARQQATSYAQLQKLRRNPLRHSTGNLRSAANRSTGAAATGSAADDLQFAQNAEQADAAMPSQAKPGSVAAASEAQAQALPNLSRFSSKSPNGQLQALQHMFEALPQRHSKQVQAHAQLLETTASGSTGRQSWAETAASSQLVHGIPGSAKAHPARDSFRLSFSPTGIPCVVSALDQQAEHRSAEAKNHLVGLQQGTLAAHQAETPTGARNAPQHNALSTQLLESGSLDLACSEPPSAEKGSSQHQPQADAECLPADLAFDRVPALALLTDSRAQKGNEKGRSTHSDLPAEIKDMLPNQVGVSKSAKGLTTSGLVKQREEPAGGQADDQAMGTSCMQSEQLPLQTSNHDKAIKAIQPSSSSQLATAADLSASDSSTSTPTLTWLRALNSPGSALQPELTPAASSNQQLLPDHVTPSQSAATAQPAPSSLGMQESVAAGSAVAKPKAASADKGAPQQQTPLRAHPQQTLPHSATAQKVSGSEKGALQQPVPLHAQPQQAALELLKVQRGSTSKQNRSVPAAFGTAQVTPVRGLKQVTPGMGPNTGFSGLTTPASAAEMHRCYPSIEDLEGAEDYDTVTLENPAYDRSFSHKALKGPVTRPSPRHPLLDLGQLASNPAFESEALSSRYTDVTPRRATPAPTAHPHRHTPTKIAYCPTPHTSSIDRRTSRAGTTPAGASADHSKSAENAEARKQQSESQQSGLAKPTESATLLDAALAANVGPDPGAVPAHSPPAQDALHATAAAETKQRALPRIRKPAPWSQPLSPTVAAPMPASSQVPAAAASASLAVQADTAGTEAVMGHSSLGVQTASMAAADTAAAQAVTEPCSKGRQAATLSSSLATLSHSPQSGSQAASESSSAPLHRVQGVLRQLPVTSKSNKLDQADTVGPSSNRNNTQLAADSPAVSVPSLVTQNNSSSPVAVCVMPSQTSITGPAWVSTSSGASQLAAASSRSSQVEVKAASQEVSSKAQGGSGGKSKRWSALAFWKKSTGKSKQPADASSSKAEEALLPVRRRSSYNNSFIALAKQGRHSKANSKAKEEPAEAASGIRQPSLTSFTCFHSPAVRSGDTPRNPADLQQSKPAVHHAADMPQQQQTQQKQHQQQQQACEPATSAEAPQSLDAARASPHQQPRHEASAASQKQNIQSQAASQERPAMHSDAVLASRHAMTEPAVLLAQSSPCDRPLGQAHNDPALPGPEQHSPARPGPTQHSPAPSGLPWQRPALAVPVTPVWAGLSADKPLTPLSSHPIELLDDFESAAETSCSASTSPSGSAEPSSTHTLADISEQHQPSLHAKGRSHNQTAASQHAQHQQPCQDQLKNQSGPLLGNAAVLHGSAISSIGSDAVVLDFGSESATSSEELMSPASSAASWQTRRSQQGCDSCQELSPWPSLTQRSAGSHWPDVTSPAPFSSFANSPGLDTAPDSSSTTGDSPVLSPFPLAGRGQASSDSIAYEAEGLRQGAGAQYIAAATRLREAVSHAVQLYTASRNGSKQTVSQSNQAELTNLSRSSFDCPPGRAQMLGVKTQMLSTGNHQQFSKQPFRRAADSVHQAVAWVPQQLGVNCSEAPHTTRGKAAAMKVQHHASPLDVHSRSQDCTNSSMLSLSYQQKQLKDEMGRALDMLQEALKA